MRGLQACVVRDPTPDASGAAADASGDDTDGEEVDELAAKGEPDGQAIVHPGRHRAGVCIERPVAVRGSGQDVHWLAP